jgi:hypothetical protein
MGPCDFERDGARSLAGEFVQVPLQYLTQVESHLLSEKRAFYQ